MSAPIPSNIDTNGVVYCDTTCKTMPCNYSTTISLVVVYNIYVCIDRIRYLVAYVFSVLILKPSL